MLVEIASPTVADYDLRTIKTILTATPDILFPMECKVHVKLGDGIKDLDGSGGSFQVTVIVGGQTIQPALQAFTFSTDVRSAFFTVPFIVPANESVVVKLLSPNAGDTDVTVSAAIYDVSDTWVDKNDRKLVKDTGAGVWSLEVYAPNGTTTILKKAQKDKNGDDISDIEAGKLAQELRSTV